MDSDSNAQTETTQPGTVASRPPARVAFVFDMEILVKSPDPDAPAPIPGVLETLEALQEQHIPFAVLHNGAKLLEQDVADALNRAYPTLPRAITWRTVGVATSPLRDMALHHHNKTVLVLGDDGEAARKVARHYGFEFVITTREIAHFFPQYAQYRPAAPWVQLSRKDGYVMRERRPYEVTAVLALWEPAHWRRDSAVVMDLMQAGGRLDKPFEVPANLTGFARAAYLRAHAPPLHVFPEAMTSLPGEGNPARASWLGHLQHEWHKRTENRPQLVVTHHTTQPMSEATMRFAEGLVVKANVLAAAGEQRVDPREAVQTPNPKTVYLVGTERYKRHVSGFGARYRDVLIKGQSIHELATPWIVAPSVGEAVHYAVTEEYWDCEEAGLAPEWPAPPIQRNEAVEALQAGQTGQERKKGWLGGVWKGMGKKK